MEIGILLAFAVLHFLLFLFHPPLRPNLCFAALAAFLAPTIYFWFQPVFAANDLMQFVWMVRLQFSVFLARDFARINKNLETQFINVRRTRNL